MNFTFKQRSFSDEETSSITTPSSKKIVAVCAATALRDGEYEVDGEDFVDYSENEGAESPRVVQFKKNLILK